MRWQFRGDLQPSKPQAALIDLTTIKTITANNLIGLTSLDVMPASTLMGIKAGIQYATKLSAMNSASSLRYVWNDGSFRASLIKSSDKLDIETGLTTTAANAALCERKNDYTNPHQKTP
jgi:hypothetical protein